jgi:hypothetical protein
MMKLAVAVLLSALLTMSVLGQQAAEQSAPTLKIVTENPSLPSDLYYGNVKVKPLRLRPGTTERVTYDDNDAFIEQHYLDFLQRFPEPSGLAGWLSVLNNCHNQGRLGSTDPRCDRVEVSSAFYRSPEFRSRGYLVYKAYASSLGRFPHYGEFMPDLAKISGFQTAEQEEANKVALFNEFITRAEFKNKYDSFTDAAAFVNAVLTTAGVTTSNKDALISALRAGQKSRAQVVREIAESPEVDGRFFNEAFVVMMYFGYLRRDPDALYQTWVNKLNTTGNYRDMVFGFVYSPEYRDRY